MAATRKRGIKHPGVVLLRPEPEKRMGWRARYRDPDSGKLVKVAIDAAFTTAELRAAWAVNKSKAIARRKVQLEAGATRATGTPFADAVGRYYAAHPHLRAKTLLGYRAASRKLLEWAEAIGLEKTDDVTRAKLLGFREQLVNEPKRVAARNGKRGARTSTSTPRSAHSANRELRATRTILGYLCDLDLFPRMSHDDLRRALRRVDTTVERLDYLKPHELQSVLEAALRHDAETFVATRDEHAGLLPVGSTRRHEPIAPLVAFVMLTGMRLGEAVDLIWKQVDLEALDGEGRRVGEIHLTGVGTKTKRARTVGLEVSPALHRLLSVMKLRSGGKGAVFRTTRDGAKAAVKRLKDEYGAPAGFGWQALRRTCGTFLTNSPNIFAAASAYMSAQQLGHSVEIAQRHYVGLARGISREARSLEAAMQVEGLVERVIKSIGMQDLRIKTA